MRVRVRNKTWILIEAADLPKDVDGECDAPWVKKKQIRIRKALSGQRRLDAYVHELTHAALWVLGEGPVASLANAVAHHLWESGLRPKRETTKSSYAKLEHAIVSIIWTRGEVAVIDEEVRRDVANSIARFLSRLGWAFP